MDFGKHDRKEKIVDCHCTNDNAMIELEPLRYECNRCHWSVRLPSDCPPEAWRQGSVEPSVLYPFCENCQSQMNYEGFGYWDESNKYFKAFSFSCSRHQKERRINLYTEEVSIQEWNEISKQSRQVLIESLIENSLLQRCVDDSKKSGDHLIATENRVINVEYERMTAEDVLFWEYLESNGIITGLSFQANSVSFTLAEDFLESYKKSKSLMATRVEV